MTHFKKLSMKPARMQIPVSNQMKKFSESVIKQLQYYVYGLKDPTSNSEYFYIGKGEKNRVFDQFSRHFPGLIKRK